MHICNYDDYNSNDPAAGSATSSEVNIISERAQGRPRVLHVLHGV